MQRDNVVEARGPDLVVIEKKNRKTVKLQVWQIQKMKGGEQSREGGGVCDVVRSCERPAVRALGTIPL